MSNKKPHPPGEALLLEADYQDFATSLLPLYVGPHVIVRIKSPSHMAEFCIPKALICKQSLYFAAMFEGNFKEGEEQLAVLEEEEDVVSARSFSMLVQWLVLGRVIFPIFPQLSPEENIASTIEFVRLADMCQVKGMENVMADHIKFILLTDLYN